MADTEVAAAAAPGQPAPVGENPPIPQAKIVIYCGVCGLPPEYCEFGGTTKKCQDWLENSPHKELFSSIYSDEAVQAKLSSLSIDAQAKAEKDSAKKAAKAAALEEKEAIRKQKSKVILKRMERNKRKFVIAITGLEQFGLDNKKVAKDLGKKFACGSSVTKGPTGIEEIVVQGDLSDDILEFIAEKYKEVPEDNIEQVEDKAKKKGAVGASGGSA